MASIQRAKEAFHQKKSSLDEELAQTKLQATQELEAAQEVTQTTKHALLEESSLFSVVKEKYEDIVEVLAEYLF